MLCRFPDEYCDVGQARSLEASAPMSLLGPFKWMSADSTRACGSSLVARSAATASVERSSSTRSRRLRAFTWICRSSSSLHIGFPCSITAVAFSRIRMQRASKYTVTPKAARFAASAGGCDLANEHGFHPFTLDVAAMLNRGLPIVGALPTARR